MIKQTLAVCEIEELDRLTDAEAEEAINLAVVNMAQFEADFQVKLTAKIDYLARRFGLKVAC